MGNIPFQGMKKPASSWQVSCFLSNHKPVSKAAAGMGFANGLAKKKALPSSGIANQVTEISNLLAAFLSFLMLGTTNMKNNSWIEEMFFCKTSGPSLFLRCAWYFA